MLKTITNPMVLTQSQEDEARRTREPTPSPVTTETTRMKKTGSRRRTHVATVREGWLLPIEEGPIHTRHAPNLLPLFKPRRDDIITQEMSDTNLTNTGYRSQEGLEDQRLPTVPGTVKKTLKGQGLKTVFVPRALPSYIVRGWGTISSLVAGGQTHRYWPWFKYP